MHKLYSTNTVHPNFQNNNVYVIYYISCFSYVLYYMEGIVCYILYMISKCFHLYASSVNTLHIWCTCLVYEINTRKKRTNAYTT